jgi:hypothetical protein
MCLNNLNTAVKYTRPGFVKKKCDNLETAKAISSLENIAIYNKKRISF